MRNSCATLISTLESEPIPQAPGESIGGENTIAEIRLGHRAKPSHGAGGGDAGKFGFIGVGGVDEAPVFRDRRMAEQKFDGALAGPGEAFLDLGGLLGDVDVQRALTREGCELCELLRRYGAQGMRRDAGGGKRFATREELLVGIEVVDEAALRRCRGRPPKPAWA